MDNQTIVVCSDSLARAVCSAFQLLLTWRPTCTFRHDQWFTIVFDRVMQSVRGVCCKRCAH